MMARPLIGSLVWAKYSELKWSERDDFVRAFADTIQTPLRAGPVANDPLLPHIPSEWRLFIEHEARSIAPLNDKKLPELPENEALILRKSPSGWTVEPGGMSVSATEASSIKTNRFVWESCVQPKVHELLQASASAQRILFVQICDDKKIDYKSYRQSNLPTLQVENFAAANPQAKFIAFHRESLLLAEKKGLTNQIDLISWVLEKPRPDLQAANAALAPYFGISQAQWRKDIQAFRANGSLEAVEYFRQ